MPEEAQTQTPEAPRPDVLNDVLTLAALERPKWGAGLRRLREEGVLLNAGEDDDDGTPPTDPDASDSDGNPDEPQGDDSPTETDDTDWKQRYEDLRPEADRRQTELDDLDGRNGPERQRAAFERRGVALDGEDEFEDEDLDEFEDLRDPATEIDEIKQELAQRDEAQEAERFQRLEQDYIEETVESLEEEFKLNEELTDQEYDLVVNFALANRDPQDGRPDLKGGMEALLGSHKAAVKRYGKTKDADELPPIGSEGEPKIDMRDKEARQKLGRDAFKRHQRSVATD